LGASGAVCAVVFSFILFAPTVKLFIFLIPFPIPAIIYGLLFLVYTSYAGRKANDGINHDAHFFGALSGLIITVILVPGIFLVFLEQIKNGLF
jgi:membrane associated rhomboid family serine protease